ncbi:hypothetical protein Poli38472_001011 [Pythium oligandrum]|uniref:Uncharacterized protein n=1 Tax=Pythium oligandrum TaxID=41045 RepID=A0A8K1CUE1_PYTOL|nr:hypothetical protein Poli38472_001011 [Pythium oligandrum]|eukprot:TMW68855.1 hypothetical protein Poli38472_001011 [Pythium oligandrum]
MAPAFSNVRIALIGAGAVNFGGGEGPWDHATRLEKLGVEFVAIVDPMTDKAQAQLEKRAAGKEFGHLWANCKIYASTAEMLPEAKPTAAFIGVPPSFHGCYKFPIELECLRAGVHVFVEKPLSNVDPVEAKKYADEVEQVRKEKNLVVLVGYMFRYASFVQKIHELLQGKQVVCLTARYNCAYEYIMSPFWWNSEHCGGPIVEQATHFADLARCIVGEVSLPSVYSRSVKANLTPGSVGHLAKVPVDENSIPEANRVPRAHVASWYFESGALGSLVHGALHQGMKYDASIEIMADGLRIEVVEPYSDCPILKVREAGSEDDKELKFPGDDMYLTEDNEFLKAVTGQEAEIKCHYSDAINTYILTCQIRDVALAN